MAAITDKLFELEATLEGMVTASGDTLPKKGDLSDIVSHLDYIIELLGTMVSAETYEEVKEKQAKGFNGIYDRTDTINELLKSGEISGDVDLYPLTITENGTYSAGAGKGYSRVVAVVDSGDKPRDMENELVARTLSVYENPTVESIGSSAFQVYSSLTTVSFPECTTIGNDAFRFCSSLTTVSFPECTTIGSNAFYSCSSLTAVSFPKCTTIGSSAFQNCYSLKSVSFPECTTIGSNAFRCCSSLTTVSFPECTTIGSVAFYSCSSLTAVSFPKCTTIGSSAFQNCYSLKSVYLNRSSFVYIGQLIIYTFQNYSNITYYVPASLVDTYKSAENWSPVSSQFSAYDFND